MSARHTLFIGGFRSTCGNCGANVDPHEEKCHPIGYDPIPPSCGERYVFVESTYIGVDPLTLRPDLTPLKITEPGFTTTEAPK